MSALAVQLAGAVLLGATACSRTIQAFAPAAQIKQRRPYSQLQAAPSGPTSSDEQRAGRGGYSVLRQPLSWDDGVDPTFAPPQSLDEDDSARRRSNVDWFEGKKRTTKDGRQKGSQTQQQQRTNAKESSAKGLHAPTKSASHHRTEESEQDLSLQSLDLRRRTYDTLDYSLVLGALAEECATVPGRAIIERELRGEEPRKLKKRKKGGNQNKDASADDDADADVRTMPLTAQSVQGVHRRYAAVAELRRLLSSVVPLRAYNPVRERKVDLASPPGLSGGMTFDLESIFDMVDAGQVLEGPEILEVATTLELLQEMYGYTESLRNVDPDATIEGSGGFNGEEDGTDAQPFAFVELPKLGESIDVDEELLSLLTSAFDDDGRLSGDTFPGIGRLRAKVRALRRDIISTLDTLLTTPSISSKLSLESGGPTYSEVNGRIVIPVADKYKNSVGIMHDVSRSGRTVYVEPNEIVGVTNEMRQAEVELRAEEARVWRQLTESIVEHRDGIERAVAAAAQIDLVVARYRLGEKLRGTIPTVRNEGVMNLKEARHPVLLLRDLDDVVANDIDNFGADGNQGMVLTGPNSGGKTIILKLMGLVALMARAAIPVPAREEGARVDFFGPVLADIGDIQSVDGDLSTFSGHMLVCREVLANSGENALVLMDEPGSGTDPSQGVAIAQALLESLLESGSRVAITTHFLELKQLAASDDRFSVGGMQFVNGRPTYKLQPGVVGESFALAVAERLKLPPSVISRATELLDSETRQMGDLIRDMEDQKATIDRQAAELAQKQEEMKALEVEMKQQQQRLEAKQLSARRDEARKFAKKLEEKEQILEDIIEKLKKDPSKKLLARSWDDIRFVKRDALTEAENVPSVLRRQQRRAEAEEQRQVELIPLSELREKPDLNVGDTLVICKKDSSLRGKEGTISKLGKKIELNVGSMPIRLKMSELALPISSGVSSASSVASQKQPVYGPNGEKLSKAAQRALGGGELGGAAKVGGLGAENGGGGQSGKGGNVGRLESNTVDCRGMNFEDAKQKVIKKMGTVMMQKRPVVYILHGHGTGALKTKIRSWLQRDKQWVKSYRKADQDDGGDAFTMVEVKKVQF